jgi:hypothetical protein
MEGNQNEEVDEDVRLPVELRGGPHFYFLTRRGVHLMKKIPYRAAVVSVAALAALGLSVGVASASPSSTGNGTHTVTGTPVSVSYSVPDIGGNYVCTVTRSVKTAGKTGGTKDTIDNETCSLSDISRFGTGTFTGTLTKLANPPWTTLAGTLAAVYYVPAYPLNADGTQVQWIWSSDFDGKIATAITFTITADGSGGGTLVLVAHYNH